MTKRVFTCKNIISVLNLIGKNVIVTNNGLEYKGKLDAVTVHNDTTGRVITELTSPSFFMDGNQWTIWEDKNDTGK